MKDYKVNPESGMLDPRWVNSVRPTHILEVGADSGLMVEGVKWVFRAEALPPGTKVMFHLYPYPIAFELAEYEAERGRLAKAEEERERQYRLRCDAAREKALAFNATIKLPVHWVVGIKDVLSGLSENSWGDGRNQRTVHHVLLQEPLDVGRLHRNTNDFLCTSASKNNGKRWSGRLVETHLDGDGKPYQPQVTCKNCLDFVKRFQPEKEK